MAGNPTVVPWRDVVPLEPLNGPLEEPLFATVDSIGEATRLMLG